MTDYLTMRTRIIDEIDDDGITAQVNRAIQSAIKHHERTRFYFNQKVATFNTVAAQEYYGAADLADIQNLLKIDAMAIALNGVKGPIAPVDFGWIDGVQGGQSISMPHSYSYYAQQIRFFPIPDAVYSITMAIHYRFQALAADGDSNAWTTDAEELIRQRAKIILHLDITGDEAAAQRAASLEADAKKALIRETRTRMADAPLYTEICALVGGRSGFDINRGY